MLKIKGGQNRRESAQMNPLALERGSRTEKENGGGVNGNESRNAEGGKEIFREKSPFISAQKTCMQKGGFLREERGNPTYLISEVSPTNGGGVPDLK